MVRFCSAHDGSFRLRSTTIISITQSMCAVSAPLNSTHALYGQDKIAFYPVHGNGIVGRNRNEGK